MRKDNDSAHDRRLRVSDEWANHHRRQGRHIHAAEQARDWHRLPELQPVSPYAGIRQRRLRAEAPGRSEGGARASGFARPSNSSIWHSSGTASRANCPADSSSVSRLHARSSSALKSCCLTSLFPHSTRSCARRMRFEIRHLQRQIGMTTVLVTHDQEEALSMSDHIVVMNKGNVEQEGPADKSSTRTQRRPSSRVSSARRTCSRAQSSVRPMPRASWSSRPTAVLKPTSEYRTTGARPAHFLSACARKP